MPPATGADRHSAAVLENAAVAFAHEQRRWQLDVAIIVLIAIAITVLLGNGEIDFRLTRPFFDAGAAEHWPLGRELPWSVLYKSAPWITASLVLLGLFFLMVAFLRRSRVLQRKAMFVTLSVVLGPGLLVNGIFKDHWNRPRPRDVIELGGALHYTPAPLRGEGGKSFPCGHCSVGFLYGLGWWLWRRRRLWAIASLAVGLTVGVALGIGRMAAGGHFPSDIAWAAFISFAIAHWLYWYVLKIPAHEADREPPQPRRLPQYALPVLAALGAVGVLTALFVTPHGELIETMIPLRQLDAQRWAFEFSAPSCDVAIVVVNYARGVHVTGETHGFGVPGGRLAAGHDFIAGRLPTLRYSVEKRGWFTDYDCQTSFDIPATNLQAIAVHLDKGSISITDRTSDRVLSNGTIQIDARTLAGRVTRPQ